MVAVTFVLFTNSNLVVMDTSRTIVHIGTRNIFTSESHEWYLNIVTYICECLNIIKNINYLLLRYALYDNMIMTPIKRSAFASARHIIWSVVPFIWEDAHYIRTYDKYSGELICVK